MLSQSEWLDADQYWQAHRASIPGFCEFVPPSHHYCFSSRLIHCQAFVEKHHFYHNHLACAVEDPESKDYDAKQKVRLVALSDLVSLRATGYHLKADLKRNWEAFDGCLPSFRLYPS